MNTNDRTLQSASVQLRHWALERAMRNFMWRNLVVFCLVLGILVANASEYREATIVRIRLLPNAADEHSVSNTGTATLNGGETYALTISLDDTYYTVIFTRKWKWSFSPSGLAPGD